MSENPYVRVYQSVADDPKFVGIYDDDHHFSTWVRLLMAADAIWPASSPLPANARKASIRVLSEAGVIDVSGTRFRVRGLDAERERRQTRARASAEQRWSGRNASVLQSDSVSDAASRAPASARSRGNSLVEEPTRENDPWDEPEHEAVVWLSRHGCSMRPGDGYHQKLVLAVERHGVNALVGWMDRLASAGTRNGDIKGFLFGAIDALDKQNRPKLSQLDAEDRAEERDDDFRRRLAKTKAETAPMRAVLEAKDSA